MAQSDHRETKWILKEPTRIQYLINECSLQSNSLKRAQDCFRDADTLSDTDVSL